MTQTWPRLVYPERDGSVTDDDLQAYVDGQLEGRRRAAVEAYLAERPDEAARLAAYRDQNIGLHALFDPPNTGDGNDSLPPHIAALAGALDAQLHSAPRKAPQARAPRHLRRIAASVAMLLTAGTAGWIALEQGSWRSDPLVAFTRQASETPASETPVQAVAATAGVTATTPDGPDEVAAWLAALPGNVPTTVPDLEGLGFSLVDEQLLPSAEGPPTAQLLYQDGDGQRISLMMRTGGKASQTSFTFTRDGEESRFVWQDAHMAYSLIGRMAQDKLLKIAEAISESLRNEAPAMATQEAAQSPATTEPGKQAPVDPAAPDTGTAPLLDKSPLIPVPLPEADTAKET